MNICCHLGESSLLKVTINRINVESYICEQCDVIWYHHADAGNTKGTMTDYILAWLGYRADDRSIALTLHGPVDWPDRR